MKVLLTGATGFVGSHILDSLCARGIDTTLLLRQSSNRRFIEPHLQRVGLRLGSIADTESLCRAVEGVTHVIHCAGLTRAQRFSEFYEANQIGTRNVVEAVDRQSGGVQRVVYISSLAAVGPVTAGSRVREDDAPHPVSDYGRSKLNGEDEVRQGCRTDFVILRPPTVYGPRDDGFIHIFRTVKAHVRPIFLGGLRELSFVFAPDLAEAVVACLLPPAASRKTYFVCSPEIIPTNGFAREIAAQMKIWAFPLPFPTLMMWPVCAAQEAFSWLTGRPAILNRQKYADLRASAWVCDPTRLRKELGVVCSTPIGEGIAQTVKWYRENGWL
jgi:nucleoside-diphosphate-sugar epimerase